MRTASLQSVIVYYDGPEIFISKDEYELVYLSIAVPTELGTRYVSVPIKSKDIHSLASGKATLRGIMEVNAEDSWYLSDPLHEGFEHFSLQSQTSSLPLDYLPDQDFSITNWLGNSNVISELAILKGRPVASIRVSPPESDEGAKIKTNTLAALLIEFQKLVRNSFKKTKNKNQSNDLAAENLTLNTLAFGAGSFRVYFESATPGDLFGGNELERSFSLIHDIISTSSDTDATVAKLQASKGHFVSSLRRMLEILDANDSFLEVEWTKPNDEVHSAEISRNSVRPLLEKLNETESLSKEIRFFVGIFIGADANTGNWKIKTIPDGDELSGRSNDPHILSGIVIESQNYSITCEEEIEEDLITGRERKKLTLTQLSIK